MKWIKHIPILIYKLFNVFFLLYFYWKLYFIIYPDYCHIFCFVEIRQMLSILLPLADTNTVLSIPFQSHSTAFTISFSSLDFVIISYYRQLSVFLSCLTQQLLPYPFPLWTLLLNTLLYISSIYVMSNITI